MTLSTHIQSLEIAGTDYMRTRGAARAGAAPRALDPAASPTLNVGATHGRGSEPITGPQQVQHHPLQQPTARQPTHSASLSAIHAPATAHDGSRDARGSRTARSTPQLTPSQQSFVDYVETKIRNETGLGSRASIGSGDAGAHLLNSAESNKLERARSSARAPASNSLPSSAGPETS